jgi:outer membrane immunogenic protein
MKYKPLLLSPLGLIPAGLPPADAADMPVKAQPAITYTPPSWAGFYAGVNLGVIGDRSKESAFLPVPAPGTANTSYCWADSFGSPASACTFKNSQTAYGVIGGLQVGYNFQAGNIVFGAEADFDGTSARKTTLTPFTTFGTSRVATEKTGVEALGTARLRLGYAFDRALLYATGGLAYAKMVNTFQANTGYAWSDPAGWRTGYTAGGGLEYRVTDRWSVKGEGLYYSLGSKDHVSFQTLASGQEFGTAALHDRMTGFVARLGVNYLFH